jgi:hypothetical protein
VPTDWHGAPSLEKGGRIGIRYDQDLFAPAITGIGLSMGRIWPETTMLADFCHAISTAASSTGIRTGHFASLRIGDRIGAS